MEIDRPARFVFSTTFAAVLSEIRNRKARGTIIFFRKRSIWVAARKHVNSNGKSCFLSAGLSGIVPTIFERTETPLLLCFANKLLVRMETDDIYVIFLRIFVAKSLNDERVSNAGKTNLRVRNYG